MRLYDLAAERALLGALFLRPEKLPLIGHLSVRDLFNPRHQKVLQAMRKAEPTFDVFIVGDLLGNELDNLGGLAFLSGLAEPAVTADNVEHYAEIVAAHAVRRQLLMAVSRIKEQITPEAPVDELSAALLAELEGVLRPRRGGLKPLVASLPALTKWIEGDPEPIIETGFSVLDWHLGGMRGGELIILAARPGQGKTALACAVALHASARWPVAFFSLEMSSLQILGRIACAVAGVDSMRLRRSQLLREDITRLFSAIRKFDRERWMIDDTPSLAIGRLAARARAFAVVRPEPVGLILVDYLQLVRAHLPENRSREQEVAHITSRLKALGRQTGWPVLAIAQLNRAIESRKDKRPVLSDLRESGALEQDADVIMFLQRGEDPSAARLYIEKHRHGPTGVVDLLFTGKYGGAFENAPLTV